MPIRNKRNQPDTADPGSCSECGGQRGRHNQVPYSKHIRDKNNQPTGRYQTAWKNCPRAKRR